MTYHRGDVPADPRLSWPFLRLTGNNLAGRDGGWNFVLGIRPWREVGEKNLDFYRLAEFGKNSLRCVIPSVCCE